MKPGPRERGCQVYGPVVNLDPVRIRARASMMAEAMHKETTNEISVFEIRPEDAELFERKKESTPH